MESRLTLTTVKDHLFSAVHQISEPSNRTGGGLFLFKKKNGLAPRVNADRLSVGQRSRRNDV